MLFYVCIASNALNFRLVRFKGEVVLLFTCYVFFFLFHFLFVYFPFALFLPSDRLLLILPSPSSSLILFVKLRLGLDAIQEKVIFCSFYQTIFFTLEWRCPIGIQEHEFSVELKK